MATGAPYFNCVEKAFTLTGGDDIRANGFIKDCSTAFTCRALASTADNYSTGATFFIGAGTQPRCLLESTALSIFKYYTKSLSFDASKSGAEWWTQVIDSRDEIGVHWDRDYGLEGECGLHAYPLKGTVSYFSAAGAPTLVMVNGIGSDTSSQDITGEVPGPYVLSFPRVGKHVAFDGRALHGAPVDMIHGENDSAEGMEGRTTRVTFLVNIWVDHVPTTSVPYPAKKVGKLQPPDSDCLRSTVFDLAGVPSSVSGSNTADRGVLAKVKKQVLAEAGCGNSEIRGTSNWHFVSNQSDLMLAVPIPTLACILPFMRTASSSSSDSGSSSSSSDDVTNLLIEYGGVPGRIVCKDEDAFSQTDSSGDDEDENENEDEDVALDSPTKRIRVDLDR
jgi:hypothetical protein